MELYTSLVQLKQAMNGGQLPPMTPVPENVQHLIDPTLTIGMGALMEDAEKGLRCPVRACGAWMHRLQRHWDTRHADIGGSQALRRALSLPHTVKLVSQQSAAKTRDMTVARQAAGAFPVGRARSDLAALSKFANAVPRRRTRTTVAYKNLANNCVAQLSHRLIDLNHRVGRSPSENDARVSWGPEGDKMVGRIIRAFGTWNNAKAMCGLEAYTRGGRAKSRAAVMAGLSAYYDIHNCLPTVATVRQRHLRPLLPSDRAIMRALRAKSWQEAMEYAASLLNIYGGRYGLPEKKKSA